MAPRRLTTDVRLLTVLGALTLFGLIALTSASSVLAYEKFNNSFYFIKHQILFGLIPGIIFFIAASKIPYTFWKKTAPITFGFSLLLLILVLIPGVGSKLGGARSWFIIGGLSFQPAELVKLTFLFYCAAWLEKKGRDVESFQYGFLPFLAITAVVLGLIALQPDVGTMVIVFCMGMLVFFLAGGKIRHMALLGLLGLAGLFLLIKAAPYRAARLLTFIRPEMDLQGSGYQINQALLAVGSGGLWGVGFGQSRQKFRYLPEVTGDSIFAIIAEELGFFLAAGLVLLFLYFLLRVIDAGKRAPDVFGRLLALGIGSWIAVQAIINIGAMVKVLPLTGLPLPFISYGGTSLAMLLAASGIIVNISKHSNS